MRRLLWALWGSVVALMLGLNLLILANWERRPEHWAPVPRVAGKVPAAAAEPAPDCDWRDTRGADAACDFHGHYFRETRVCLCPPGRSPM